MSLVDYASSSDDDVPEPTRHKEEEPPQPLQRNSPQPPPQPPPSRTQIKYGSSPGQPLENKPHSSASSSSVEKLPDASLLLNSPFVSSNLVSASDHSSRVAAALAENASRKRDSNGMASSTVRNKAPRGNLPHSKSVPETTSGLLVPPQIGGRKNVVTEDISKLFVKKH